MEAEKISKPDLTAYFEQVFAKKFNAIQSMEGDEEATRLPGVAPPIRRRDPGSYSNTPFSDEITSIEMPRKFAFPNMKMYYGTC